MRSVGLLRPSQVKVLTTKAIYLFQETTRGLKRGGWMNWAAISTMAVLLFLFGISLQTSWQVNGLLGQMGSRLEVYVYLQPDVSGTELRSTVVQFPEVAGVDVVTKDDAWQDLLADLGVTNTAQAGLDQNPLVDELKIRTKAVTAVPQLAAKLARVPGVETVEYLNEALRHLTQLSRGLSRVSFAVVGLLTLAAIAVIMTTIRLIVVARHQEIEVMQLVGATTTWIYLPFLLQGVTFGVIGAAIAWGFMTATREFTQNLLTQQPNFLQTLTEGLRLSAGQTILLPFILVGFGTLVGFIGSILAVRRFT